MHGIIGAVGVMHLEADDLAAVEIEDQGISLRCERSVLVIFFIGSMRERMT